MDILEKLNIFTEEKIGTRPIQFMKWYKDFHPGDRADVEFGEDYISIIGSDAEGNFAGGKKEVIIDDQMEMDEFELGRRNIWNFV